MTAVPNIILLPITDGDHTITVYAGDIASREAGSATVNFKVSVLPTQTPYIILIHQATPGHRNPTTKFIVAAMSFFESTEFLYSRFVFCCCNCRSNYCSFSN
jgi:hypothetical protein